MVLVAISVVIRLTLKLVECIHQVAALLVLAVAIHQIHAEHTARKTTRIVVPMRLVPTAFMCRLFAVPDRILVQVEFVQLMIRFRNPVNVPKVESFGMDRVVVIIHLLVSIPKLEVLTTNHVPRWVIVVLRVAVMTFVKKTQASVPVLILIPAGQKTVTSLLFITPQVLK